MSPAGDADIVGTIRAAHSIGLSVEVRFVDGRRITFSLRGDRKPGDLTRLARAINDGIRWQDAHQQEAGA